MRKYINKFLITYFKAFDPAFLTSLHPYYEQVSRSAGFDELYDEGILRTQTKVSIWRKDRFYNLYSAVELVRDLPGNYMELGCYRGLSSYLTCTRLKQLDANFNGGGYSICDSFEGLSKPKEKDGVPDSFTGMFATPVDVVREVLSEFPHVQYHKGWIPEVFATLPEQTYKFVHVDVDLMEPTLASFEYFFPRMVNGGVLICDDYGSKIWKGTKNAVDEYCIRHNCKALRFSTGQIMIIK